MVSTNTTLSNSSYILANSSTGNLRLSLPGPTSSDNVIGRIYHIKKTSTSNNVIISGALIDGRDSLTLNYTTNGSLPSAKLINSGNGYYILEASANVINGVASDNLVLWWPFDTITSSNQSPDLGAAGKHGNLTASTPGVSGQAISLNSNNYLRVISNVGTNLTGNFSISAWVKRGNSGSGMLISKKNGWNIDGGYEVELNSNYIRVLGGTTDTWADSNSTITWGNTWRHITATFKTIGATTYVTTYLDGSNITSADNTTDAVTSSTIDLHVGNRSTDNSVDYIGDVDEIRFFNTTLSAAEVTSLYGLSTSVASTNLTAYWNLDSLSSGNVANLTSGTANHAYLNPTPGTITGLTTGVIGQAISLDGVDDYVTQASIGISASQQRTFAGWVKVSTWTNDAGVWHSGTTASDNIDFSLELTPTPGTMTLQLWGGDADFVIPGSTSGWHHIAITYNGTSYVVYADGQSVLTNPHIFNASLPDNGVTLGSPRFLGAGGSYFHGLIDDFRVYNIGLTQAEVQTIYAQGN